jgi:hypothetical protein
MPDFICDPVMDKTCPANFTNDAIPGWFAESSSSLSNVSSILVIAPGVITFPSEELPSEPRRVTSDDSWSSNDNEYDFAVARIDFDLATLDELAVDTSVMERSALSWHRKNFIVTKVREM